MWTTRYILRDIDDLIAEIKSYVARYDITALQFYDLTAITKKRWTIEFCNRLIAEGLIGFCSRSASSRFSVPSPGARSCPALTRRDDILEILVWPSRSFDFIIMALIASTAGKPAMAERALLAKIQTCIGLPRFIFRIAARRISLLISTPFAAGRGAGKVSGTRAPRRRLNRYLLKRQ